MVDHVVTLKTDGWVRRRGMIVWQSVWQSAVVQMSSEASALHGYGGHFMSDFMLVLLKHNVPNVYSPTLTSSVFVVSHLLEKENIQKRHEIV